MIPILLIALLSLVAQLFLPWWSLAVVAFVICFWRSSTNGQAFVAGFLGVALVWLGYALLIHSQTEGIFTGRMSQLIAQVNNPIIMLLLTPVLGGLVGGFAGLTGRVVRQAGTNQIANRTP